MHEAISYFLVGILDENNEELQKSVADAHYYATQTELDAESIDDKLALTVVKLLLLAKTHILILLLSLLNVALKLKCWYKHYVLKLWITLKKLHKYNEKVTLISNFLLFCVDLDTINYISIYKACETNWLITWKISISKAGYYFQLLNTKYVNLSHGNIF